MTIEELQNDYNWGEVFGEGSGGNTTRDVEAAPPGSQVSATEVSRADVAEIIAYSDGEHDERDWVGLFRMNDGRFLVTVAGCDYTGWDCVASNSLTVTATKEDAIRFALDDAQRARLGLSSEEASHV
jgi:hypothetical protein